MNTPPNTTPAGPESGHHADIQALLDAVPVGMYQLDAKGDLLFANKALRQILRLDAHSPLTLADTLATIHPEDRERVAAEFRQMQTEGRDGKQTYRYLCGNDAPVWVLGRCTPQRNERGEITSFIGSVTDLTHEHKLQALAERQSRLYATLRKINAAIIHSTQQDTLFQQVCDHLVETGGFALAGISQHDAASGRLSLVGKAGPWNAPLSMPVPESADPSIFAQGTLSHLTLSQGTLVTINDLTRDESLSPQHRTFLLQQGIQSCCGVPFVCRGQAAGILSLAAQEPGFFTSEVQSLLSEIGQEVSYALDIMQRERERAQMQAQLAQEEQNLRASERLYNTLVHTIPVGIYQADAQGAPTFANPTMLRINGFQGGRLFTHEESLQTVHPDDRQRLTDTYVQALQNRRDWTVSDLYRYLHPDGTVVWARTYASPLFDELGQFEGFVGAAVDATAEHLYQEKAERVSRFYATLTQVNAAIIRSQDAAALYAEICTLLRQVGGFPHVGVYQYEADTNELVLLLEPVHLQVPSEWLTAVLRRPLEGPMAQNLTSQAFLTGQIQATLDAQSDPHISSLFRDAHQAIATRSACSVPFLLFGRVVAVLTVGSPVAHYFTDDIRDLIAEIGRNVSFALGNFAREAQRHTAEALRAKQEEHLRVTLHSIGDAVLVTDASGCVTMMNPVAQQLTGWSEADAQGCPVGEVFRIINQETRQAVDNPVDTVLREGRVVGLANHTVLIARDGSERPIADSGAPIRLSAEGAINGVVLVFRDQTEEYRMLKALSDSEHRYASLVNTAPVGICQFAPNGQITFVNDTLRCMADATGELVSTEQWTTSMHPADRVQVFQGFQDWISNSPSSNWQTSYRLLHEDGRTTWLQSMATAIRDEQNQITGYMAVLTDITTETKLRAQSEKLSRMYATLSRVNSIITQVKDVDTLYREVCHAIVNVGQFEFTVVMSMDWEKRQLHQVQTGSPSDSLVPTQTRDRDLDDPEAQSIANLAVLSGQSVLSNDLCNDPRLSPRIRATAADIHMAAGVALPLRQLGVIVGTLGILSRETDYFTEEMLTLLDEIGRDVSHALDNIARENLRLQTEQALARNEERLRLGLQVTRTGMYELDLLQAQITLDATCMELLGMGTSRKTFDMPTFIAQVPPSERAQVELTFQDLAHGITDHFSSDATWPQPDGSRRWIRNYGGVTTERDADGRPQRLLGVVFDISSTKNLEERDKLAATVFDNSNEAIMIAAADRTVLMVNQAFTDMTGYSAEEIVGQPTQLIYSPRHDAAFYQNIADTLKRNGVWSGELWRVHKDGHEYPAYVAAALVRDADGELTHYVSQETDITEQKKNEARISHLAYRDALTDLPNRTLLRDRVDQNIVFSAREGLNLALLFLDLDHFKNINDSLGHGIGDLLLKEIAQRLTHAVRDMDTVGRLGGDEFLILLPDTGAEQAATVAQKLLKECARAVTMNAHSLMVTPSVGIALYPKDGSDFDTLLKSADTAMYRAKDEGRNTYRFFTPEMNQAVFGRMVLEANLRQAMVRNEFLLHYQPQYDLNTQALIGAEALIRWQQPELGLISPGQFIPVAEESGLIVGIGQWVLEEACRQIKAWQQAGLPPLRVAVNFSARQFAAKNIVELVSGALQRAGISGQALEVEITESLLANDLHYTLDVLRTLKSQGIQVAVDDFGTGYSSLSYLKRFPIDLLKIDQSFVRDLETDTDDRAIASAIITLGHSLGIRVIAEGVETDRQIAILRDMGCDAVQGYRLGRPMTAEKMTELLRSQKSSAAAGWHPQ